MAPDKQVLLFLVVCLGAVVASVGAQSAAGRAGLGVDQLMGMYNYLTSRWEGVGWWHSANALTALVEFCERTQNSSFTDLYTRSYYENFVFTLEGYDDEGWWALAWLDLHDFTKDSKYLKLAESIFKDMSGAWDTTTCGGGVWWDRKKTYKNAITNELFLSIATRLYLATKTQLYLDFANQEWTWFNTSGMINSENLVNDGLVTDTCKNNGETTWTYNQGVVLGGLVSLYQITNNSQLITAAEKIANATIAHLVTAQGILQELCEPSNNCDASQVQFKGVFMRNLGYLYNATKLPYYADFINNNANSIWNNDRKGNSFGQKWGGPFDQADAARQSSAVDALNAVLVL